MADRALPILAPRYRSYLNTGAVNSGGKVYFYEAGTTTKKDTYSDAECTAANANPVVLDTRGEAAIYGRGAYKVVEYDSSDNQLGSAMDGVLFPDITDDALGLLNDYTTSAMRTTLGLGTAATLNVGTSASQVVQLDTSGKLPAVDGSQLTNLGSGTVALPKNYLSGFILSRTSATVLGISAGVCRDSTNAVNMSLTSAWTKAIQSAWASGTGNGALDTGSIATSTWYHVFVIAKSDGTTDVCISNVGSLSPTATNLGLYTYYRRIGAFKTDGSSQITAFTQFGDEFLWADPPLDVNLDGTLSTAASNQTLSVPTGIKVRAILNICGLHGSTVTAIYVSSPDANDEAPDYNGNTLVGTLNVLSTSAVVATGPSVVRTNTSGQVRFRSENTTTSCSATTLGWWDDRGKDDGQ
jgi:hypothetical protein